MLYKTMILELLQQRPQLHDRLRKERMLLAAVDSYASELKNLHDAWKETLSRAKPEGDASQIASQALELALQALQDFLPPESPPDESEPLSLDGAMAFVRRHTPPA